MVGLASIFFISLLTELSFIKLFFDNWQKLGLEISQPYFRRLEKLPHFTLRFWSYQCQWIYLWLGGLPGTIQDQSKATVASATTQFQWQYPIQVQTAAKAPQYSFYLFIMEVHLCPSSSSSSSSERIVVVRMSYLQLCFFAEKDLKIKKKVYVVKMVLDVMSLKISFFNSVLQLWHLLHLKTCLGQFIYVSMSIISFSLMSIKYL